MTSMKDRAPHQPIREPDLPKGPNKPHRSSPHRADPRANQKSKGYGPSHSNDRGRDFGKGKASPQTERASGRHLHANPELVILYGYHAVREALKAGRRKLLRLHATQAALEKLSPYLAHLNLTILPSSLEEISALLPADSVHQGLVLEARPIEPLDITDLPEDGLVLVLDQITDPHNVGAILRSAAAFGVNAIVTTERHSPILTGVLAKAASGGLEHVDIVPVVNLARALEALGRMGYLRVGLDSEGSASLEDTVLSRPLALVLGSEGKGLRRLSRENCDLIARLDMPGAIKSLNVSNACAVALCMARLKLDQS